MKANSIEENEKTVDKNDIEDFHISKLKLRFNLNALNYVFLEIGMFEAIEEVENRVRRLGQEALKTSKDSKAEKKKAAAKQNSTITINSLWNRVQK